MVHLIVDRDELLVPWAAKRLRHVGDARLLQPCKAMGLSTGPLPGDRLLAVVIYHMFVPQYRSCMVSIAAASPKWCTRSNVKVILRVPFVQYGCNRVWCAMPHTDERTIKLSKLMGFKQEGVLRDGFGPGVHAVSCSMLKREFEKRYGDNGQISAIGTAAS